MQLGIALITRHYTNVLFTLYKRRQRLNIDGDFPMHGIKYWR